MIDIERGCRTTGRIKLNCIQLNFTYCRLCKKWKVPHRFQKLISQLFTTRLEEEFSGVIPPFCSFLYDALLNELKFEGALYSSWIALGSPRLDGNASGWWISCRSWRFPGSKNIHEILRDNQITMMTLNGSAPNRWKISWKEFKSLHTNNKSNTNKEWCEGISCQTYFPRALCWSPSICWIFSLQHTVIRDKLGWKGLTHRRC